MPLGLGPARPGPQRRRGQKWELPSNKILYTFRGVGWQADRTACGAGRPRGIAFDFAVPFCESGLRGLAPAPPYKPDAGEIRPWHDAVRDAKCDALAREEAQER